MESMVTWILTKVITPFKWYLIAAVVLILAFLTWRVFEWRSEAHLYEKEVGLRLRDNVNCKDNADFTQESNHDLQGSLNSITARYNQLRQAHTGKLHVTNPSGGVNEAASPDESAWLLTLDQRRLNDTQASQLVVCQNTLRYIYKQNGQALP